MNLPRRIRALEERAAHAGLSRCPVCGLQDSPLVGIEILAQGEEPSPCPECGLWTDEEGRVCDHAIILEPHDAAGLRSLERGEA